MFRLSPGKDASHHVVFDIHAVIHACSNIPHPDAQVYCKWKLATATFLHSGVTETCGVLSANRVVWDAPVTITNCTLRLEPKTKTLKSCNLRLSIRQVAPASAGGYTRLGVVNVDLAEYLGGSKVWHGSVGLKVPTCKYLINFSSSVYAL